MKKLLFSLCAILCFSLLSNAQIKINEAIGGVNEDEAIFATPTTDGGYVIVGWTTSYGVWGWDIYLAKTDSAGTVLWTKTYGANGDEVDCFVQQTADGGFVITARTNSFGAGSADVYLIKTNSQGDLQWSKTIGGNNWEEGHAILQTSDLGYIHCGYTRSFGAGGDDYYLMKNDSIGNLQWTKTYGGTGEEHDHFIQKTSDGGFILAGETTSFGAGGWDYYLVKIDALGNQQWSKTYGGVGDDHGWSADQTADGGFIMGGFTNSFGAGSDDAWLVKTDLNGNVEWTKTYGGLNSDQAYAVHQTADGGYVLTGQTSTYGGGSTDVYLVKTSSDGSVQWTKTFGGTGDEASQCVQQMNDGGFLVAGYTSSFGMGNRDFYLIKTDASGNSGGCYEADATVTMSPHAIIAANANTTVSAGGVVGTPQTLQNSGGARTLCSPAGINIAENTPEEFVVYPNPSLSGRQASNGGIMFTYTVETGKMAEIQIFDATGKLVCRNEAPASQHKLWVDNTSFASGIYFCKLVVNGRTVKNEKVVITH